MKVIRGAGTAMRVVRYERYDRLLTAGQPDSDIAVVVAAHSGDGSGADNVAAIILGYPYVWHSHIVSFQFRRDVRAPSSEPLMCLGERATSFRFLTRDRDGKFSMAFDEVFSGNGTRVVKTAVRSPRANSYEERFVGTLRRECLYHVVIVIERHLRTVLAEYIRHYNGHRPHQVRARFWCASPGRD